MNLLLVYFPCVFSMFVFISGYILLKFSFQRLVLITILSNMYQLIPAKLNMLLRKW